MSKSIPLDLSPNKVFTPKNNNYLNLNNSKNFSIQNKIEHIMINSDRNSTEKRDELNLILKSEKMHKLNNTFYEKESKKGSFNSNNDLPPVNYKKSYEKYKFAYTFYNADKNSVKELKKKVKELNGEINKLKKDSNVKNYKILKNNYNQKSKELTELKQENNYIKFQLEDLLRKNLEITKKGNTINKKTLNKLGSIKDSHSKLLQIKINEENKNDEFIKKNEILKKKLEIYKNELEKVNKMYDVKNKENEELTIKLDEQLKDLNNK